MLLTEAPLSLKAIHERMAQVIVGTFNVPAIIGARGPKNMAES